MQKHKIILSTWSSLLANILVNLKYDKNLTSNFSAIILMKKY